MRVLLAVDQSLASYAAVTYLLGLPFRQPVEIVTGDRRRGALKRLFLGSVSRHVLRYATRSVLISRES